MVVKVVNFLIYLSLLFILILKHLNFTKIINKTYIILITLRFNLYKFKTCKMSNSFNINKRYKKIKSICLINFFSINTDMTISMDRESRVLRLCLVHENVVENRMPFLTSIFILIFGIQIRSKNNLSTRKLILEKSWKCLSTLKLMKRPFQIRWESF